MVVGYLLDSNICVYVLRDKKGVREKLKRVGWSNCCISEMTVAELLYGAECSGAVEENRRKVLSFCADMRVIPVKDVLFEYAWQKARLRRSGMLIDDMDLFIGCTATALGYVLVTENVKHMERLENVRIENWTEK